MCVRLTPAQGKCPLPAVVAFLLLFSHVLGTAKENETPPATDPRIYDIIEAVSSERIEQDIRKLVGFGTRHTLSETESETRGIGAARRWIKGEFASVSEACGGCLEVSFQSHIVPGTEGSRIPVDTEVVNVIAIL